MATFFKIPIRLIKTTLAAYIVTAIMLLVLSYLMYRYELSVNLLNFGLVLTYIIPNFISGFISGRMMKEKRLVWGIISGIIYMMFFAAVNILFGESVLTGSFLLIFTVAIMGAALGGIVS